MALFTGSAQPHAGVIPLLLQHGPEQAPTRVERGFRHPCPRERRSVHVADEPAARRCLKNSSICAYKEVARHRVILSVGAGLTAPRGESMQRF